jgi:hypothetical protein
MAITFTWIGTSGDWNTAASWDQGSVPGIGDTAVIDQPDGNTITIAAGESIAVAHLIIGDASETLQVDGTLTISSTSASAPPISNAGTIILGSSGTLALGGSLTLPSLGTILNGGATTQIDGVLDGESGTLTLGTGIPLSAVLLDGQIRNATINTNSSLTIIPGNASLQDDIVNGSVDMNSDATSLTIYQGTSFADATGALPGTINLTGQGDTLVFSNESPAAATAGQTLDNVTINIGNATVADSIRPDFNGGTFTIGGNATIISNGAGALASLDVGAGTTVVLDGTLGATGAGGQFTISGVGSGPFQSTFDNNGLIIVGNGDTLHVTSAIDGGTGTIGIGTGGVADFAAAVAATQILVFADDTGTLMLQQPDVFAGVITGFTIGDTIDLAGIAADTAVWSAGQLVISNAGSPVATLSLTGNYASAIFNMADDSNGGSALTTAACYAAGTLIRTTCGEIAVEQLHEGALVLTLSGHAQPVVWIGHRHVDFRNHPNRLRVLPIRILADAFGPGRPQRDLVLSPDHAVLVEDVLIPIRHLVNGTTIARIDCDEVMYYHIELPRHDVLLAEGLPAESYLETGGRDAFANGDGVMQLHPDFAPPCDQVALQWESQGYAPLMVVGEQLDRARRRLAHRATALMPRRRPRRKPARIAA